MEVFNDILLSELFIKLDAATVTAIGHTVDETLLDKLADKRLQCKILDCHFSRAQKNLKIKDSKVFFSYLE